MSHDDRKTKGPRHTTRENKRNSDKVPEKIGENRTCFWERYKIQARCRRKQRKSKRDARKDKRKPDTMSESRGFGHDVEEPPE